MKMTKDKMNSNIFELIIEIVLLCLLKAIALKGTYIIKITQIEKY